MSRRRRHRHGYHPYEGPPYRRAKCVDIDPAVCLQPYAGRENASVAGFIVGHDATDRPVRCDGSLLVVPVDNHPVWSMTGSLEAGDLTLSPSVLCKRDGFHGFVQNGRWVPA
jgi:hypothetical protein